MTRGKRTVHDREEEYRRHLGNLVLAVTALDEQIAQAPDESTRQSLEEDRQAQEDEMWRMMVERRHLRAEQAGKEQ